MNARAPRTLASVVGRNLRSARQEAGATRNDVAVWARRYGFPAWRRNTVQTIEDGRRLVTAEELLTLPVILSAACGRPVELLDLTEGWGVEVPTPTDEDGLDETTDRAARMLGVPREEVLARSLDLWGRSLYAEREARTPPGAGHGQRGWVTRSLLAELRAA